MAAGEAEVSQDYVPTGGGAARSHRRWWQWAARSARTVRWQRMLEHPVGNGPTDAGYSAACMPALAHVAAATAAAAVAAAAGAAAARAAAAAAISAYDAAAAAAPAAAAAADPAAATAAPAAAAAAAAADAVAAAAAVLAAAARTVASATFAGVLIANPSFAAALARLDATALADAASRFAGVAEIALAESTPARAPEAVTVVAKAKMVYKAAVVAAAPERACAQRFSILLLLCLLHPVQTWAPMEH